MGGVGFRTPPCDFAGDLRTIKIVIRRHERGETCLLSGHGRGRVAYGQIEQLTKELEMPSAMLTDRQGWGGRSGQGFHCANMKPLLDRTAHRTRSAPPARSA